MLSLLFLPPFIPVSLGFEIPEKEKLILILVFLRRVHGMSQPLWVKETVQSHMVCPGTYEEFIVAKAKDM